MKRIRILSSTLVLSALVASVLIVGGGAPPAACVPSLSSTNELGADARRALASDGADARAAIARLRAAGPGGLDALFAAAGSTLTSGTSDPLWSRASGALDAVAGQRDVWASHLYWYTDLEAAKAAARATGRPILSLRLLGRLDDDLSCANSRYFRTALYANEQVSRVLRDQYVLHWSSERPVPRITIDFGDGRRIERTITGNSAHYMLDASGRPVDVLPGLYGPSLFLQQLALARPIAIAAAGLDDERRGALLRRYHEQARVRSSRALVAGFALEESRLVRRGADLPLASSTPTAFEAGNRAETKMASELPMLRAIDPIALERMESNPAPTAFEAGERATMKRASEVSMLRQIDPSTIERAGLESDPAWGRAIERHRDGARLDARSRELMRRKLAAGEPSTPGPATGGGASLSERIATFEQLMAVDQVRNEYGLHARVHAWFESDPLATPDFAALNERVYTELFLTPRSDAWLGLAPRGIYAALDGDGLRVTDASVPIQSEPQR